MLECLFLSYTYQSRNIERKRNLVKEQIIIALSAMCNCAISTLHIQNDAFGCGVHDHLITYRGRILGGLDYSALGLVELMQSWIDSRQAFIVINSFRMQVDPECPTRLDTINAADCPLGDILPPGVITPTTEASQPSETTEVTKPVVLISSPEKSGIRAGEAGGIAVGVLILVLLIALVLLILGIIFYKGRYHAKVISSRLANIHSRIS